MTGANSWENPPPPAEDSEEDGEEDLKEKFVIPDFSKPVEGCEFDFDNPPPRPVAVLRLNGQTISTPGNITNIQAKPKEGKTTIAGGVLSSVIVGERDGCDTLGFSSSNPGGGIVLLFDTEQSHFDSDTNVRRALNRAKYRGKPDWVRSFCLTGKSSNECYQFITSAMRWAAAQSAGLFMVVIDGVADLCTDVNDAQEANFVVRKLQKAAIDYHCVIVTVLHENPGSETGKTRGHLGSQLERKAETSLRVAKDTTSGIVTIWAERARNCMIPKSEGHCIRYDKEQCGFVSCGSAKQIKANEKLDEARQEVLKVFDGGAPGGYSDLCRKIMDVTGLKIDSAKKRVKSWTDLGLIHNMGEVYVMCSSNIAEG